MPDSLPEAINQVRSQALNFIEEVLQPLEQSLDDEARVPMDIQREVQEASRHAGLFYKTQPAEFGGNPGSQLELTVLREIFAAVNLRLCAFVFGPAPGVLHSAEAVPVWHLLAPHHTGTPLAERDDRDQGLLQ